MLYWTFEDVIAIGILLEYHCVLLQSGSEYFINGNPYAQQS